MYTTFITPAPFVTIGCVFLLMIAAVAYADEKDQMAQRFPADIRTDTTRPQTVQPLQPRQLKTQESPGNRESLRIQERMPVTTQPASTQDLKRLQVEKPLDQQQRLQIQEKLNVLKIQTRHARDNALQLERQINDKQRILDSTTHPQAKQELQLEIGRLHEQLNQVNNQIQDLENQQQIMRQMTTGQQDFADDEDHLSDSGYGPGQSNMGDRRQDSPCFIATAAYGSPLAREIEILRQFRNNHLAKTPLGRRIITLYETYSPPVADFISRHEMARSVTRVLLWPVVMVIKHPVLFILSLMLLLVTLLLRRNRPVSYHPY